MVVCFNFEVHSCFCWPLHGAFTLTFANYAAMLRRVHRTTRNNKVFHQSTADSPGIYTLHIVLQKKIHKGDFSTVILCCTVYPDLSHSSSCLIPFPLLCFQALVSVGLLQPIGIYFQLILFSLELCSFSLT